MWNVLSRVIYAWGIVAVVRGFEINNITCLIIGAALIGLGGFRWEEEK